MGCHDMQVTVTGGKGGDSVVDAASDNSVALRWRRLLGASARAVARILTACVIIGAIPAVCPRRSLGEGSTSTTRPPCPVKGLCAGGVWTNSMGMQFVAVPGTRVLFSRFETTNGEYRQYNFGHGSDDSNPLNGVRQPVVWVSWNEAKSFCRWLTQKEIEEGLLKAGQEYRLPTDQEWSAAVGLNEGTGGTPSDKDMKVKGVYPWGTNWPPPAGSGNFAGEETDVKDVVSGYIDRHTNTAAVGSYPAEGHGLHDMAGNVWEWCEDLYCGLGGERVVRGGSWVTPTTGELWSSYRRYLDPLERNAALGFRCVLNY